MPFFVFHLINRIALLFTSLKAVDFRKLLPYPLFYRFISSAFIVVITLSMLIKLHDNDTRIKINKNKKFAFIVNENSCWRWWKVKWIKFKKHKKIKLVACLSIYFPFCYFYLIARRAKRSHDHSFVIVFIYFNPKLVYCR